MAAVEKGPCGRKMKRLGGLRVDEVRRHLVKHGEADLLGAVVQVSPRRLQEEGSQLLCRIPELLQEAGWGRVPAQIFADAKEARAGLVSTAARAHGAVSDTSDREAGTSRAVLHQSRIPSGYVLL